MTKASKPVTVAVMTEARILDVKQEEHVFLLGGM
jgi:hypothetical protein